MGKANVFHWLKEGWTKIVDPERETRLNDFVIKVHRTLSSQRQNFDFGVTADQLEIPIEDRADVIIRLFKRCVEKAWSDGELAESELRSLQWIARKIGINEADSHRLLKDRALEEFERVFGNALLDGKIDEQEQRLLQRVAAECGSTPAALIQSRFQECGEAFVRNLFLNCWSDGRLDAEEWADILASVRFFGMSDIQFREAISSQAKQAVEHSLADFQSDGELSKSEEQFLEWMLGHLISDELFASYVRDQIEETKLFANIAKGKLPSIRPLQGMALRAGEIVHYSGRVHHIFLRRRSKSEVTEDISGIAAITDDRLIFVSADASFQILHSRVLGFSTSRRGFELQCSGKGAGLYKFDNSNRLPCAIWSAAIGKVNQTIVSKRSDQLSRHIPRDVRQRVWQKYGGRCAECNAEQYLEFDHIVPVAKGGSNTENNVQLLCRGCNLSKSDAI